MQKYNKKASILIWAIFLSLILSISFLSISTKITKVLKNRTNIKKNIKENISISNKLQITKNNTNNIKNFEIKIENKTLKKSLKKYEQFTIEFPESSTGSLTLTSSGILYYNFGGEKGFLDNTNTKYNFQNKSGDLKLESYSGIVSFDLNANNKFEFSQKKYKITETIGNRKIIKQFGILK